MVFSYAATDDAQATDLLALSFSGPMLGTLASGEQGQKYVFPVSP
jgi:hypothetical protein